MSEFSINNPNGYLAGPLGSFRVYGADGRLKAIGAGGGGGATWGTITGNILNQTDLIDYITNHAGGVPTSRTLSINGVTYDLSADRSWTIPAGGTVTDVTGTGTVSGLTLSGSGTTSVTLTLGGSLSLTSGQVTSALGYTPYNATNPAGYLNQTAAGALYYPLSSNPSNYVTSSSLASTLSNYLTLSAASNTYLTIVNAASTYQPIFTPQNGLTYGAGLLKLGGQLSENTTIDGKQGTYSLSLLELSQLTLQASDLTNTTEINLTPTQMQVKTPLYGSKTIGDVLTLKDPSTGEVEFETPTSGPQSLQDVTNVGSTTTNAISVDSGTGDYSYIGVNSVGAYNSTTAGYTQLSSSGTVSLTTNSVGIGILSANNVATGNVQLEFPNKPTGTYTIATTADIPTGGGIPFAVASGTDTYTATITGVTAYADGDAYLIRFTNGNTDAATLNINSLGPIPLHQTNQIALIGGDIWDGGEMLCIYNATDVSFECIGTSPNSLFVYVTNVDSSTITKGQAVYAFGGTGNRMTVKLAQANADSTSAQTIGFVYSTSIAANQKGIIIMQGYFTGLSLFPTSSSWADGDPVYLSPTTAGAVTKTKPYAPDHLVYLGFVATASNGNAGRMYVRVQNGYELDELHNVQAQNPSLNDTLWYDSSVSPGQWKTASIPTILGYTPGTVTSVSGTGTTAGLSLSGSVTGSGSLTLSGTLSTPVNTISDSTTVGQSLVTLANPSAIRYIRINANNTASTIDAATLRSELGIGNITGSGIITLNSDISLGTGVLNTSFVDITGLSFPITAGRKYSFRGTFIITQSGVATGIRLSINADVAVNVVQFYSQVSLNQNSSSVWYGNAFNSGAPTTAPQNFYSNTIGMMNGYIDANNTGTAVFRFSKWAGNAGTTTVKAGSFVEYTIF